MLMNGCPENTSSVTFTGLPGVGQNRKGRDASLATLAEMDRHYRVRRQVLHEPLWKADAAHFLVFLSPGSSRPTIG
jgi:hypothetical protein